MVKKNRGLENELKHRASIRTPSPPGLTEEQKAALELMDEEERAWESTCSCVIICHNIYL